MSWEFRYPKHVKSRKNHTHMIAWCTVCGLNYDIDFEPHKDCDHPDSDWTIELINPKEQA